MIKIKKSFLNYITLSGATTLGQSRPGSDGNERVLHIPQTSSIIGTSPSDYLVSYLGHSLWRSYPSAEVQSVYSTAPDNWAINEMKLSHICMLLIHKLVSEPVTS